jgi:S-formylglutathione hydrolase FrmB
MGGHGGMWLSIRHKDVFGAGGSTSGGVDIRPFPMNWEMNKQLGEFAANKGLWDQHTVINQLDKIQPGDLSLIIDCGEGDFFLTVNQNLHEHLLARRIDHDFILRPGVHNGQYWHNSIDYQILFFQKFFLKK